MSSDVTGLIQIVNFSALHQKWLQNILTPFGEVKFVDSLHNLAVRPEVRLNIVHICSEQDVDALADSSLNYSNLGGELFHEAMFSYETLIIVDIANADLILKALRCGADDAFLLGQLEADISPLLSRINETLYRCRLIREGNEYRESLEATLKELQDDQQAAYQLQKRILPNNQQVINGLNYEYSLLPSLVASGDFVDVITIDSSKTLFYVADVSGHGTSSALITVLLKNLTFRLLRNHRRDSSHDILSPLSTIRRMNVDLCALGVDKHLTIFCGLIDSDSNTLTYTVGGHHPMPILKSATGAAFLEGRGMPVGLFLDAQFDEFLIPIDDDFSLTVMSDGVLELLPEKTIAEKEASLLSWISNHAFSLEAFRGFVFNEQDPDEGLPDDITIMYVSRV